MKIKDKFFSIWIVLFALFIGYILFEYYILRVQTDYLFRFIIMNVFSIMIPGMAVVSFLDNTLSKISRLCLCYSLGYAVVVLEYFFCEIFDRRLSFSVCSFLVGIVSIIVVFRRTQKKRISFTSDNSGNDIIGIIFFCIIAFISVFVYSANYLGIESIPVVKLFQDMGFWCTNTVALKLQYPAERLWALGADLNYHYFSSIPIAFLSDVYAIDVYTMSFQFYSLTKTMLLVGSVTFLLDVIGAKKSLRVIGYFILLLSTGLEYMVNVTFIYYLYYRPFGFDYGYSYGILFMSFLLHQWKQKHFSVKNMMVTIVVWAMCVGGKGPIAAILIVFAGLICLYWLIDKRWKKAFGYGISILFTFIVISYFCTGLFNINSGKAGSYNISINNTNYSYIEENMTNNLALARNNIIGALVVDKNENYSKLLVGEALSSESIELSDRDAQVGFVKMICDFVKQYPFLENIVCIFFTNPLLVIGIIVIITYYIVQLIWSKVSFEDFYLEFSFCVSSFIGLVLGIILNVVGHSEMYFSIAAFIPMSCMILVWLSKISNREVEISSMKKKFIYIGIYVLIVFGMYNSNFLYWKSNSILYWSKRGYEIIRGSFQDVDYYSEDIPCGIRNTDVEALRWIRDNTEKDAILLVDKGVLTDIGQYYLYGIFAERQTYFEYYNDLNTLYYDNLTRKELIRNVYNNDEAALDMVKNEGVTYIVQTKDITPEYIYNKEKIELLYYTDTMNIYKIK